MSAEETLSGRTIAVTAERRAHQQVRYFESRGATVRWVPVVRTIEPTDRAEVAAATAQIAIDGIDILIAHTGQSLTWWLDTVATATRPQLDDALQNARVFTRGSKASSAARRAGLHVDWQAPNEVVDDMVDLLRGMDMTSLRCAVLLDGNDERPVVEMARARGATVIELDVYRYGLPEECSDIDELVSDIVAGDIDVVTFTASPAIRHLRSLAATTGRSADLDAAFSTVCRPAVVGPVCAATATAASWGQIIEPATARLIPMLDAVVEALAST